MNYTLTRQWYQELQPSTFLTLKSVNNLIESDTISKHANEYKNDDFSRCRWRKCFRISQPRRVRKIPMKVEGRRETAVEKFEVEAHVQILLYLKGAVYQYQ